MVSCKAFANQEVDAVKCRVTKCRVKIVYFGRTGITIFPLRTKTWRAYYKPSNNQKSSADFEMGNTRALAAFWSVVGIFSNCP